MPKSTGRPWLDYAISEVGYREGPGNANKFSRDLGYPPEPWCDDFVADVCLKSGFPLPSMSPGCRTGARAVVESMRWAQAHGLWIRSWQGQPGDQLVYGWDGPGSSPANMHTGFGIRFGERGAVGRGVEGNRGDQVQFTTFTVGERVLLGVIDLNRLLLGRPKITVKESAAKPQPVSVDPQPRHPDHPANTGPTRAQRKARRKANRIARDVPRRIKAGGGVRKAYRHAADRILNALKRGRKR